MPRIFLPLLFFLLQCTCLLAQPRQVLLNNENYYVYPFRMDWYDLDIPPCLLNLPDGKYLAYQTYHFKWKKYHARELVVKDTANIVALFEIKNKRPEGKAYFYSKPLKAGASARKINKWAVCGNFSNGVKNGEWMSRDKHGMEYEHYKDGLKHGEFISYNKSGEQYTNRYKEGKPVGRSYSYYRDALAFIRYHDSLGIRDTVYDYYTYRRHGKRSKKLYGKLDKVSDRLYNEPTMDPGGICKKLLLEKNKIESTGNQAFSFLREYDEKGVLETDIRLAKPGSYYFDSALINNERIYVRQIGCGDKSSDTCYVVKRSRKWPDYPELPDYFYYRNQHVYKIRSTILLDPKKPMQSRLDTIVELYMKVDSTLDPWKFQAIYIGKRKENTYRLHTLPALGYSYSDCVKPDGSVTPISTVGRNWISTPRYWSYFFNEAWAVKYVKPTFLDTVQHYARFIDTVLDRKTQVAVASNLHLVQHKDKRSKISEDILGGNLTYPVGNVEDGMNVFDDKMSSPRLRSMNGGQVYSRYAPETILKDNRPFSGMASYGPRSRNKYDKKRDLLKLSARYFGSWYYDEFLQGPVSDGKRTGTWHLVNKNTNPKMGSDLKKYFFENKKCFQYTALNYENGYKNGPAYFYATFVPMPYSEEYDQLKGKSVKYLCATRNFKDDWPHGESIYYHHNGAVACVANFDQGWLEGEVVKYNSEKQLIYKAFFKDGKLDGYIENHNPDNAKLTLRANFYEGKLNGKLEMFGVAKWLEVGADTGKLLYKKLFYDNNTVREEITLDAGTHYTLRDYLLISENFLSFCPDIHSSKRSGSYRRAEKTALELDSVNNQKCNATYKSYYNTGQLYCEGRIEHFKPVGEWKFYDIGGTMTNKINFKDSVFNYKDTAMKIIGTLAGYYGSGKPRCRAFVKTLDVSYDCNTHADKNAFDLILKDNFDYYGKDNCVNGSGPIKEYNESGVLEASGKLENYMRSGLWKFYDPNGKLNKIGSYTDNKEEGIWFEGDLEGLNFEDAACFDKTNEFDVRKFQRSQKRLEIKKVIYKNGKVVTHENFSIDNNTD